MNTIAFAVCFAAWTLSSIIGIKIKSELSLTMSQFGLLVAVPFLSGALSRLPLGLLTEHFGGRWIFAVLMVVVAAAIYALSLATEYWHFLVAGLWVGLAGGSFSVGISYTATLFDENRQRTAAGFLGVGNIGAALTNIAAPLILVAYGWRMVPRVYAAVLLVTTALFLLFTHGGSVPRKNSSEISRKQLAERIKPLRDLRVWRFALYYFFVFGGFVALALWLPNYIMSEYKLSITSASFVTLLFTLPGTLGRSMGGWLSDEYGSRNVSWAVFWVSIVCLFFLSYPPTSMTVYGIDRNIDLNFNINLWLFGALIFVIGFVMGLGKASVYHTIPDYYPTQLSTVGSFVGTIGALGGFVMPVVFGLISDLSGIRSTCFMFLYGLLGFCMISMYYATKSEEHLERLRYAAQSDFLADE